MLFYLRLESSTVSIFDPRHRDPLLVVDVREAVITSG